MPISPGDSKRDRGQRARGGRLGGRGSRQLGQQRSVESFFIHFLPGQLKVFLVCFLTHFFYQVSLNFFGFVFFTHFLPGQLKFFWFVF